LAGASSGEGSRVTWDLNGVEPGLYTAAVEVHDNQKHGASSTMTLTIQACSDCVIPDFPCPLIAVTCYDEVKSGPPITCKVAIGPSTRPSPVTFAWFARDSDGEDLSKRITSRGEYVSITTYGLAGKTVYVRVELKGLDPSCNATASGSTVVKR